ncbi:phosphatidate cytidylyltransferase [Bengtsoniella intestinalis]|uniref:phosphatidate cytidylyltransferase n=1 Tax=Bengtsoniella intestinalis TaxID=3073143 RepID=UPI00391EFD31
MRNRVLVAVVGVPFLLWVLGYAPVIATAVLVVGMCAIGAWELMHAVTDYLHKPLAFVVAFVAGYLPVWIYTFNSGSYLWIAAGAFGFVLFLFIYAIAHYEKETPVPFGTVSAAVFAGVVFPLMLSCLLRLRMLSGGNVWVFIPLAIAFGSDTFALFAGMLFGRHKLAPHVSPKKTREGAVGGVVGGIFGMMLISLAGSYFNGEYLDLLTIVSIGAVGSLISQLGDLSFSVVKREFGVKDYGHLLPGHGGILDRFDSVSFVAPAVWLMMTLGGGF